MKNIPGRWGIFGKIPENLFTNLPASTIITGKNTLGMEVISPFLGEIERIIR